MANPNLKAKYNAEVAPALMQKFGYKSIQGDPPHREDRGQLRLRRGPGQLQGARVRRGRSGHHHRPEARHHQGQEVRGQLQAP